MPVRVESTGQRVSSERLARVADRLLEGSTLCALATVGAAGNAYVNTMYFARGEGWDLVWLSAPSSRHSSNIRQRATAAIAVYDSSQRWGHSDRGIQVFGRARKARGRVADAAVAAYVRRFKADHDTLRRFATYVLRPTRLKLCDEREFGDGTFVTARVARDGTVTWERTETYRDSA